MLALCGSVHTHAFNGAPMPLRDRAFLPGPLGIWIFEWVSLPAFVICAEDVALWPKTTALLGKVWSWSWF